MNPLVSVIMTAYNSEKYIEDAIKSILNQTYRNLELIIIEDVSTDGTLQVIKQFSDDRIRLYCNEKNSGTLYGMQRGMSVANGKYIAILDSDDISFSSRIEKQVSFLQTHPEVLLCATKADNLINGKVKKQEDSRAKTMEELRFSMLFANNIVHSTVMFRRSEIEKRQIKYERFSYCHDYYFLLEVAAVGWIYRIDEVLGLYRIHSSQKTHVLPDRKIQKEVVSARTAYVRKLRGLSNTEKNVLCKAIKGQVKTYKEYKTLGMALKHYIRICKLGKENKMVIRRECTCMLMQQEKNEKRFFFGMTSSFIDKKLLLSES